MGDEGRRPGNLLGQDMQPRFLGGIMKVIDAIDSLYQWLNAGAPEPAAVLGLDLRHRSSAFSDVSLAGSFFLGCKMDEDLVVSAYRQGASTIAESGVLPPSLPAFGTGIYTVDDLYAGLDADGSSWENTPDYAGFRWFMKGPGEPKALDLVQMLSARLHDSVQEREVVTLLEGRRVVAIMGGHDFARELDPADAAKGRPDVYWQCVEIAKTLSEAGFLIMSGGGPGLMEAANLGALLSGADAAKVAAVRAILTNHKFGSPEWRATGLAARELILGGAQPSGQQQSLGIPTWFYGHEPPNMFASHHAKMFYNSLREDGLVTWANSGILYFEGNAGTVQEIFQDASQNYYPTPGTARTPMIFFNANGYWDRACDALSSAGDKPMDKRKPLLPLIRQLAAEKDFLGSILVTADPAEAVAFITAAAAAAVPTKADLKLHNA